MPVSLLAGRLDDRSAPPGTTAQNDDRVLDADRSIVAAIALLTPLIESQPDLLELAAVVAGRLASPSAVRLPPRPAPACTGVTHRWATRTGGSPRLATTADGAGRCREAHERGGHGDHRGAPADRPPGERRRTTSGWDSLTPTELRWRPGGLGPDQPQVAERLIMSRAPKTH